jgi:hypothetical protein
LADPLPRFQVGTTCYDGAQAAANAWLAAQQPFNTAKDLGYGDGVEPVIVVPSRVDVPVNGDPPMAFYEVRGLNSGAIEETGLSWYPTPCELDAVHAGNVANMGEAFLLLLGACAVLFLMRQLIGIFSGDTER